MPSISAAGIGSGLDVASIISQLMDFERQPLVRLQLKQSQYEAQISAYGQLSSELSLFQDAMKNLSSLSALKVFNTTSSDSDVINVTATSSADLGSFDIEVVRIADNHKMASAESLDTTVFGGAAGDTFTIQVGSDVTNSVSVDLSSAMSLEGIRDAINNDVSNPGVSATIVNGNNGNQKLILTSDQTGTEEALTLSYGGAISAATFGFQTLNNIGGDTSLLDAEIIVDGYVVTRSSNNIADVISGVTLNLVSADPGTTHTVGIERDLETIQESVQSFADSFNQLRASIKSLRGGQLEADSALLSIERQMLDVLNNVAAGGTYSYLSEIGLTIQKDGTMALSSSDLESALQSDFDGVAQLLAADGEGYANRLNSLVDGFLSSGGLIDARTDGLDTRIDKLLDRQILFERNLERIEARYLAQFTALDSLLGQLQGISQFLTTQLDQLPGTNQN